MGNNCYPQVDFDLKNFRTAVTRFQDKRAREVVIVGSRCCQRSPLFGPFSGRRSRSKAFLGREKPCLFGYAQADFSLKSAQELQGDLHNLQLRRGSQGAVLPDPCYLRISQFRLRTKFGYVRLGYVKFGYFRLGYFRSGYFRLGYFRFSQIRLFQVRLGQVRFSQIRLLQDRLFQIRLFQATLKRLERA